MEEFHNARLIHTQAAIWGEKGSNPRIEDFLPENVAYERMMERRRIARESAADRSSEAIRNLAEALMGEPIDWSRD